MKIRRCALLFLEAYEEPFLDLDQLISGGDGVRHRMAWRALAPHLDSPLEVREAEYTMLGSIGAARWIERERLSGFAKSCVDDMLRIGLLISDADEYVAHRQRDDAVRKAHWWAPAALAHRFGRWHGLDCVEEMKAAGTDTMAGELAKRGPPPPATTASRNTACRPLPRVETTTFDELLAQRTTCRNFDIERVLPLETLSGMLQRVFAATGSVQIGDEATFLKKNVPSAGGLHCVEAYLLVRRTQGMETGLYHYQPLEHALESVPSNESDLDALARRWLAGQHWFADAHVLVAMVPRYERMFWKYRNHAKAYRAMVLDVGHLSQLLYLSATELGLGAFVTSAVNEVDIEQSLGMDALEQGPLAVCGFGWRANTMRTSEFDPGEHVWTRDAVPKVG